MDEQRTDEGNAQVSDQVSHQVGDPSEPGDQARPVPTLTSMVAVGAGLLVATGLFFILGEVDGIDQRGVALAISLLFLALGVALSTINRSNRSAAAGVVISALAVVPLTVYLFANADVFGELSGGEMKGNPWDGLRGIVTLMLATAAVIWLVGYVFGRPRRFGFYLGAALIAIWLIPVATIQISSYEDLFSTMQTSSSFGPTFDSSFDSSSSSGSSSSFDSGSSFDEPSFEAPAIPDPSTRLGAVSLAFGLVYLAFAALRDRRGDARMATAALAPALLILVYALSLLAAHIGWVGIGLLAVAVGSSMLAVGLRGGRRASSWIGVAVATAGFAWLVAHPLQDSPRAIGAMLTLTGVVIALAMGTVARRPSASDPAPPADPGPWPFGPPAPAGQPAAPPFGPPTAAPFGAPPDAPGFTAPTPPPTAPPSEPPPWSQPF